MKANEIKTSMDFVKYTREKLAVELSANPETEITDSEDLSGLDEVIAAQSEDLAAIFLATDKQLKMEHYTDVIRYMKEHGLWNI